MLKHSSHWIAALTLGILLSLGFKTLGQAFNDVTLASGVFVLIDGDTTGNGVSAYDWNNDGYDDLSFCTVGEDPKFYENIDGQSFVEVGPFFSNTGFMRQMSWVDFDNDGDADIFVTYEGERPRLFQNDGEMNFADITVEAGFPDTSLRNYGFCWGDYDEDGLLDVYVSTYWDPTFDQVYEVKNHLYRNNGDGTFDDVTMSAGVGNGYASTLAVIWIDYDNNGSADLFVVNDKEEPNALYRNNADGTFTNVSVQTNTNQVVDGMTATVGDLNNDGWFDIYITNTSEGNLLLLNDGQGSFIDITETAGVEVNEMCWAGNWIDYDNNGFLDLHVCTQGTYSGGQWQGEQNFFYVNNQDNTFTMASSSVGLEDDDGHSYCSAQGDFNKDGFCDFALSNLSPFPAQIWESTQIPHYFIELSLRGTESNRDAIGSTIAVWAGGQKFVRHTYCGENYLGQNSQHEIFGLGNTSVVDSVVVDWPNGLHENFGPQSVNQDHLLVEGSVGQIPVIESESDFSICQGGSTTLSAGDDGPYFWNTGQQQNAIEVDEPGEYWVQSLSPSGDTLTSQTVEVSFYPGFTWQIDQEHVACFGEGNGSLTFLPAAQSGGYQDVNWTSTNGLWLVEGLAALDLTAGPYYLNFVDQFGCNWYDTTWITEPDILFSSLEIDHVTCHGFSDGSAQIEIAGGTFPYVLDWGNASTDELEAGDYSVMVSDSLGCQLQIDFSIEEPAELIAEILTEPITQSAGGSATANVEGGTEPYTFEWSSGESSEGIDDLAEGDYTVWVTDSLGCEAEASITLTSLLTARETTLRIYPNPVTEILQVESNSASSKWEIRNTKGQMIIGGAAVIGKFSIDTSNIPAGHYSLIIRSKDSSWAQIFIKQ